MTISPDELTVYLAPVADLPETEIPRSEPVERQIARTRRVRRELDHPPEESPPARRIGIAVKDVPAADEHARSTLRSRCASSSPAAKNGPVTVPSATRPDTASERGPRTPASTRDSLNPSPCGGCPVQSAVAAPSSSLTGLPAAVPSRAAMSWNCAASSYRVVEPLVNSSRMAQDVYEMTFLSRLFPAANVVAIDAVEDRLAIAKSFGADPVHLTEGDPRGHVKKATGGRGVDVAIDAVGHPDALELAIRLARKCGTVNGSRPT